MGLPHRLRPVDLLACVENDAEFLAINPAGFIPALQDGDVTMVESIAIMEYLMGRHGPTPLAPHPHDPAFPAHQQYLHLGEAGLAASIYFVVVSRDLAEKALEVFESRLRLVRRRLARSPYLAGDTFTAADISVTYALELAQRSGTAALGEAEGTMSPAPPVAKPTSGRWQHATPRGSGPLRHAANNSPPVRAESIRFRPARRPDHAHETEQRGDHEKDTQGKRLPSLQIQQHQREVER